MLYELILAQSMAAVLGGTLARYQFTIGVYLASMGLGAYLASLERFRAQAARNFWRVEIALAITGGLTTLLCVELGRLPYAGAWAYAPWIILIGCLGGAELPLLIAIAEKRPNPSGAATHSPTVRILAADYAGMLVAAASFVAFFLPRLGLFGTGWLAGALNAAAAASALLLIDRSRAPDAPGSRPRRRLALAALLALLVAGAQLLAFRHADSLQQRIVERAYLASATGGQP